MNTTVFGKISHHVSTLHSPNTSPPRIGRVALGAVPRVVVAVRDNADRGALETAMAAGASIVEARIDEFARHDKAYVQEQLERLRGLPLLATIRYKAEGGGWKGSEAERLALYEAVLPHCDAVDAEIYARDLFPALARMAREAHKTVIGSYHDFQGMPTARKLTATSTYGMARGAHIVKVAAMCRRKGDLEGLARFLLNRKPEHPTVLIGMGAVGAASRVFLPLLGSLLTYTFLGEATAPGQLTLDDTLKYLSTFCPGFPGPQEHV